MSFTGLGEPPKRSAWVGPTPNAAVCAGHLKLWGCGSECFHRVHPLPKRGGEIVTEILQLIFPAPDREKKRLEGCEDGLAGSESMLPGGIRITK